MALTLLLLLHVAFSANIEVSNNWIHNAMDPLELSHHFGVQSSHQVDPLMYQVINIKTEEGKWEEARVVACDLIASKPPAL